VARTAEEIKIGSPAHMYVSQHLETDITLPPISNTLLGAIFSSLVHAVVTIYDDGSMLVMVSKVSTVRYEPISIYIDKNGEVRQLGSTGGGAYNGDRVNITGSGDPTNAHRQISMRCTSWSVYGNTTADGLQCDQYSY
jgi:hypothetical protein